MPATAVPVIDIPQGVATPLGGGVAVDAINGNSVQNNSAGKTFVRFTKTDAGAATVAVTITRKVAGQSVTPVTFTIPATTGDVLYPLGDPNDFGSVVTFVFTNATAGTKMFPFSRT
ncbi:hypothetical protein JNUCC0626_19900 [Lentzea sp. JNUCC 0626]|uniref:hypothetical protein n=1 Tax=Lentzea sp. JNUCC 0626 TaxID=3367513 RepID=UPI003748C387